MNSLCLCKFLRFTGRGIRQTYRRWLGLPSPYADPSEARLALLDPYSQKYDVSRQIEKLTAKLDDFPHEFSFAVWGDVRDNYTIFSRLWKAIREEPIRFSFLTGDLVRDGWVHEWLEDFLPVADRYATVPFFPTMGNHDFGSNRREYLRIFRARDYWFDFGNARFMVLDNASGAVTQQQLEWLEARLQSAGDRHTFLFAHMPPHTIEKWAYYSFSGNAERFCDLLSKYQLTHAFFSHIHAYSTAEFRGVNYTVSGGGGSRLHRRFGEMGSVYHYVMVYVMGDDVLQQVVRLQNGRLVRGPAGHEYCQSTGSKSRIRLFFPRKKRTPHPIA